jgi:ornithine cyclodeaminase/alanine dehydrogenase-like protein (mu-crystallin family)
MLCPGMVVVSIGSTAPEQREIDPRTVEACDLIVADQVDEVMEETGDFIAARAAGVRFEHKVASLNDLVMGKLGERVASARLPMYKSVGAALQDIAVAEIAVRRARERGLAVPLPIELDIKHV